MKLADGHQLVDHSHDVGATVAPRSRTKMSWISRRLALTRRPMGEWIPMAEGSQRTDINDPQWGVVGHPERPLFGILFGAP